MNNKDKKDLSDFILKVKDKSKEIEIDKELYISLFKIICTPKKEVSNAEFYNYYKIYKAIEFTNDTFYIILSHLQKNNELAWELIEYMAYIFPIIEHTVMKKFIPDINDDEYTNVINILEANGLIQQIAPYKYQIHRSIQHEIRLYIKIFITENQEYAILKKIIYDITNVLLVYQEKNDYVVYKDEDNLLYYNHAEIVYNLIHQEGRYQKILENSNSSIALHKMLIYLADYKHYITIDYEKAMSLYYEANDIENNATVIQKIYEVRNKIFVLRKLEEKSQALSTPLLKLWVNHFHNTPILQAFYRFYKDIIGIDQENIVLYNALVNSVQFSKGDMHNNYISSLGDRIFSKDSIKPDFYKKFSDFYCNMVENLRPLNDFTAEEKNKIKELKEKKQGLLKDITESREKIKIETSDIMREILNDELKSFNDNLKVVVAQKNAYENTHSTTLLKDVAIACKKSDNKVFNLEELVYQSKNINDQLYTAYSQCNIKVINQTIEKTNNGFSINLLEFLDQLLLPKDTLKTFIQNWGL